jgi:hypothetical protein
VSRVSVFHTHGKVRRISKGTEFDARRSLCVGHVTRELAVLALEVLPHTGGDV